MLYLDRQAYSRLLADIRKHISENAAELFPACLNSEGDLGYHAAVVIKELIAVEPNWIVHCPAVLNQLIERWVSTIRRRRLSGDGEPFLLERLRK